MSVSTADSRAGDHGSGLETGANSVLGLPVCTWEAARELSGPDWNRESRWTDSNVATERSGSTPHGGESYVFHTLSLG